MKTASPDVHLKSLSLSALQSLVKEWKEPAWVTDLRSDALQQADALPWPDKKNERWRRTDPDAIPWDKLALSTKSLPSLDSETSLPVSFRPYLTTESNGSAPARAFFDLTEGRFQSVPEALKEQKIQWLSLDEAIRTESERIKSAWTDAIKKSKGNKFSLLNLGLARNGAVLILPKGALIKTPFHTFLGSGRDADAKFLLNFFFLEEAAQADIWEESFGSSDSQDSRFVSSYNYMELKENAKASLYLLQHWNDETSQFQFQDVVQHSFSKFNAVAIAMGGAVFHNEMHIELKGQGAENKVLGVLFGDARQNFVNWITQNHLAPKTMSDIQYRGALKGQSKSFFSGMVFIDKPSQQSDAFQSAKSLLLSKDATADSIPNLEILADDVKCSHGAAVGPVDEDQKYYLATRGISSDDAEEIIIQGFFEPVISEVPSPIIQERLRTFVEDKIRQ